MGETLSMSTVDILIAARKLLARRGGWTQKHYARSKSGRCVSSTSRAAVCFCAVGAIERVTNGYGCVPALDAVRRAVGDRHVIDFNDDPNTSQRAVVRAFDRAIEASK